MGDKIRPGALTSRLASCPGVMACSAAARPDGHTPDAVTTARAATSRAALPVRLTAVSVSFLLTGFGRPELAKYGQRWRAHQMRRRQIGAAVTPRHQPGERKQHQCNCPSTP